MSEQHLRRHIRNPEERIQYLEEVNRLTWDALEMAGSIGRFQTSIRNLDDASTILRETRARVKKLIPFKASAFFLVDETSSKFLLADCEPEDCAQLFRDEVDFLINNGTFSWALREERPIIVSSRDHQRLVLHAMSTVSGIRGMFIGLLAQGEQDIPHISLALLSIVMVNSASILESFELYKIIRDINVNLEKTVQERTEQLTYRVKLENLIATTSTTFINLALDEIDTGIDHALQSIGEFIGADHGYVLLLSEDGTRVNNGYEWCAEGVGAQIEKFRGLELKGFPLLAERIRKFENLHIPSVAELPLEAKADSALLELLRIESLIVVPMVSGKAVIGLLGFDLVSEGKSWPDDTVALIKIVGEIFINALQRKGAEEALRESEQRYRRITEAVTDYVFTVDIEDGHPVETVHGAGCVAVTGYSSEEFDSDPYLWIRMVHEEDRAVVQEQARHLLLGQDTQPIEHRIFRKDGVMRWVRNTLVPNYDIQGKLLSYDGLIHDITERREAEEAKARLEAQLRQAQKMEAIGTLAGGIAHDFNNTLMPIIGNAQIALMDIAEGSPIRPLLERILKAGNRAKDLIGQILTFSRQVEQDQQPLQMSMLIKETLKLLRSTLPSTIRINRNIQAASDTVIANPTQIHQILLNLCTNAAHAMQDKGGVLEVSLTDIDLDSEAAAAHPDLRTGRYVRLTVSDTGHGMDRVVMERIFEPFFTTKGVGEGTGMGLSTVHGIVKSHGGAITVHSEPQNGSTFHVYLPLSDIVVTDEVPTTALPLGTEHILFVDDEEWIVTTVQLMLERLSYKVTALTSSLEALEVFRAQPDQFDLVITDITMPDMTGEILARELTAIRPNISIILCTGYSERIGKQKSEKMGIAAYVMKPINVHDIAKTIRRVLDKTDAEKQ